MLSTIQSRSIQLIEYVNSQLGIKSWIRGEGFQWKQLDNLEVIIGVQKTYFGAWNS